MTGSRVIWAGSLLLLLINYIFSQSCSGLILLAGAFVIPLMSVVYTAIFCRHIEAEIIMPDTGHKGEMTEGIIRLGSSGKFPVFRADINVSVNNIMTGEKHEETLTASLRNDRREDVGFFLTNSLCGLVRISFSSVRIYDMFGIWKKDIKPDFEYRLKVLPDMFTIYPHILPGLRSDNESIEYSAYRAGSDMSETFGIREYREGDSIRNIHWKLTGKYDDIMIRLPSLPLENSLMLMLETGLDKEASYTPEVFDSLAEICITMSQTLIDNGITHSIAWYDRREKTVFSFDIESEDALNGVMSRILSIEYETDDMSAPERYISEKGYIDKAHLVYVTSQHMKLPDSGYEGIRVTEIVCSDEPGNPEKVQDSTTDTVLCTVRNYKQVLREIRI